MRHAISTRVLFHVLWPVVLFLVMAPATRAAQPTPAERPTYQVGERWVRTDGKFELARIEANTYVFVGPSGREIHLSRDLTLQKVVEKRTIQLEFDPPLPLKWPLRVGSWGQTLGTWRNSAMKSSGLQSSSFTWQVKSYESITLLGRSYRAFRIVHTWSPEPSTPATGDVAMSGAHRSYELSTWYVPELKKIVRGQHDGFAGLNFEIAEISEPTRPGPAVAAESRPPPVQTTPPPIKSVPDATTPSTAPHTAATSDVAPLRLLITWPEEGARVVHENLSVEGIASGGVGGVVDLAVVVNGSEVARVREAAPRSTLPLKLPVKLREGANSIIVTARDASGAEAYVTRTLHLERSALVIDVRHPTDDARVSEPTTLVAAIVRSERGVASVRVNVNGVEVHKDLEDRPRKAVAISLTVPLREGMNAVVISAEEPDGTVRHEMRTLSYVPRDTTAGKQPEQRPTGERWAVVIGIGRYHHRDVPHLPFAPRDAEAVYRLLTERAGFPKENVLLLTDNTERRPTLRDIKWAMGTFLSRRPKREDTVVIFYAGHGAPEVDPRGVEPDGLAKYLVPADADPDDLYSTALAMDELENVFARIEAERVIAFFDTCYSGAAGGRTFVARRTRSSRVDDIFLERLTRMKGRVIITASRPNEVSLELGELRHGLFTYYLLRGLEGAADLDRDGIVSLQELYQYVQHQVAARARAEGGKQQPMLKGELTGELPLIKLRP